jgi:CheY-like chemotaxis protein
MVGAIYFGINLDITAEKPMIVLVVDDIPLNRDIAVALLSKENCKCDVAVDGVEAVAAFKQKAYLFSLCNNPLYLACF